MGDKVKTWNTTKTSGPQRKQVLYNPVDKGWAWVILVCLSFIQMIVIGLIRSFGILFVAIQREHSAPASMVSLVFGIQAGLFGLTAMVSLSIMLKVMSVRMIVMIGGVVTTLGFVTGFFASSVVYLVAVHSTLVGIGFSLCFCPSLVLLGVYFDQRRAMAAAVANTGGSVGSLLLPYVTEILLEVFGLRGAFLIMAGIAAQNIVLACFFTPPSDYRLKGRGGEEEGGEGGGESMLEKSATKGNGRSPVYRPVTPFQSDTDEAGDPFRPRTYSDGWPSKSKFNRLEIDDKLLPPHLRNLEWEFDDDFNLKNSDEDFKSRQQRRPKSTDVVDPRVFGALSVSLPVLNYDLYMQNNKVTNSSGNEVSSAQTRRKLPSFRRVWTDETDDHDDDDEEEEGEKDCKHKEKSVCLKVCPDLSAMFDVSLFKSPTCWVVLLYNIFGVLGVSVPPSFIPPLAVEKGLTVADGALLLMLSGGLDIVSRLAPGLVVQMKWMKARKMVCISFIILGAVFQFTSLYNSWPSLALMVAMFGLCAGMFLSMMQLIIIDFVGLERFPRVFGLTTMMMDLFSTAVFPFLGFLRDTTGSYTASFHTMGACLLLSAAVLLLEPLARRIEAKMADKGDEHV